MVIYRPYLFVELRRYDRMLVETSRDGYKSTSNLDKCRDGVKIVRDVTGKRPYKISALKHERKYVRKINGRKLPKVQL